MLKLTNILGEDEDSKSIRECAIECYKKIDVKNPRSSHVETVCPLEKNK